MDRDIDEVLASQNKMLVALGVKPPMPPRTRTCGRHISSTCRKWTVFSRNRRCFTTMRLGYKDVIDNPSAEARRLNEFLGDRLNVERMTAVADRELYRNRKS